VLQSDTRHFQDAHLAAVKAAEAELTDGPDAALQALGAPTDPIRIKAALGILIRAHRNMEAADLIRNHPPDERWVDIAAFVFASLADIPGSQRYVDYADACPDRTVGQRARVGFAEGTINRWHHRLQDQSILATGDWPPDDVALAHRALDLLDPVLSLVRGQGAIDGDLQFSAVIFALYCSHVQHDDAGVGKYAAWLVQHRPLPLVVAELCLRGIVDLPSGLPTRLRLENPQNYQAAFLAALVERDLLNRPEEAFDALAKLSAEAISDAERSSVCVALFETSGACSPARIDQAISIVTSICPSDVRLLSALQVARNIAIGDLAGARTILNETRDETDGVWWQAHAQVCEREGDEANAQLAWERASEYLPHPDVIRRSVQASFSRRSFASAIRGLKTLLANNPHSVKELSAISAALVQVGDYAEAARYLADLVAIDPANVQHRLALAQCLGRSAQLDRAIETLEQSPDPDHLPLEASLVLSELLQAAGKPQDAFTVLARLADDNWNNPRFLLTYMHRAHAASQDQLAHNAFMQLEELRRGGEVPSELMQAGTLEQLLEYGKEFRTRREMLQGMVVDGRMPWLFVEDQLGNPPIWAWMLHTQQLSWLSEDKLNRAAYTVYATNGFTVSGDGDTATLKRIDPSPPNNDVVVDLSALVTLFQLGRLESAAKYFGRILLPASYGDLRIHDATRYGQHQPSREEELRVIRRAIDSRRIHVADSFADLLRLDEYHDIDEPHCYHLVDLVQPLKETQKVSDSALDELSAVAHKPSAVDSEHPSLRMGTSLLVDLATLRTLAGKTVFEPFLDLFRVHVLSAGSEQATAELRAYEEAKSARGNHDTLWDSVTRLVEQNKIQWQPVQHEIKKDSGSDADDTDDSVPPLHLDALVLADQLGRSLLVDDRVLQVGALSKNTQSSCAAFGVDRFLEAIAESDNSQLLGAAADFRRMMRWRFRFLVPSPVFLLAWAREYIGNLPGDALLDTAYYLHDSLRDPGLHCGFESTSPPMPMAAKFVTTWIDSIVTFLADVWDDDRFSDQAATSLTEWVGSELVPSCPRGLAFHQVGLNIAWAEVHSLIGMAFVKFTGVGNRIRANTGLRVLASALGMDEHEFLKQAAEAIHAIRRHA
jgi:tetratricopeptide (TPR) repeat protein